MSVDPTPADVAFTMPDILSVRRPLSHLGIALERRHRQLQGIDIDLDAAIEAHVQKLAGSVPDEAVYLDMVRSRRDLGVLVLLDVSGSSAEPATIGGSVFEHQRKAALALTVGLHDLGDRVALYAFRSQGRAAVQVERLKRFDDTLDASVLRRLAGCEPGCIHASRCRHTARDIAAGAGIGSVASTAGRPVRRVRVRPRLRGHVRRGGRTSRAGPRHGGSARAASASASAPRRTPRRCGECSGPRLMRAWAIRRAPPGRRLLCFDSRLRSADAQRRIVPAHTPARGSAGSRAEEGRMNPGVRPYYVPVRNEEQVFKAAFDQQLADASQGADRVRENAFRRGHGPRPGAAAHHRRLSRRSHRRRSRGAFPARGRRDHVGRRAAHACGRGKDASATSTRSSRLARTRPSSSIP